MKQTAYRLFLLLLLGAQLLQFSSCRHTPQETDFSLTVADPQITVAVGEPVTYRAELRSLTGRRCALEHAWPLISVQVYPEGETREKIFGSAAFTTELQPHETVEKTLNTEFLEPGSYIVWASCWFEVNGTEFDLETSVAVTVTEAPSSWPAGHAPPVTPAEEPHRLPT